MSTKHNDLIQAMLAETADKDFQGNKWGRRHCTAWTTPRPWTHEAAIIGMITSIATYADAHNKSTESRIGEDGVLGDLWADSIRNVRGMLNGEIGRLDGGALDSLLLAMLTLEGFGEN